jgi:hypothetical protein
MKVRPAAQEKRTAKTKRNVKKERPSAQRLPKRETTAVQSAQPVEAPPSPSASLSLPAPVFVRRDITVPDGSVRSGWEMWIGEHCFGRADSKELLLASFQRLQSPPESFHWREVRNRMQMRNRPRPIQPEQEKEDSWEENDKEEPLLLGEEEAEGFQELTWENPA